MSWTKNNLIRCDGCGLFCTPVDSLNVFGQASYDPPEPYDPEDYCLRCAYELYLKWDKHFAGGGRSGDWVKSKAEQWAAEKYNLEWVHSSGFVDLRTELDVGYCYILKSEKRFYEPHLDWHGTHPRHNFNLRESQNCLRCGADWKTGNTQGTRYCHQVKPILAAAVAL